MGMTKSEESDENVTQGSIGGPVLSSCNISKTLCIFFDGSPYEISYADLRLRSFGFQDDTCRFSTDLQSAQNGNIMMEAIMKRKQLSLNLDKCATIIFDKKRRVKEARESLNSDKSLKIFNEPVTVKEKVNFLGDILHEQGVTKSAEVTVNLRYGRMLSTIYEISEFLKDFRADSIGAIRSGLMIYEMAVIPALLFNSNTWCYMNNNTIKTLENLQTKMFSVLFGVSDTAPRPILRFDLGCLTVLERIHINKLTFVHFLQMSDEQSLAHNFYEIQVKYDFPSLVSECRELIEKYQLPNIIDDKNLHFSKQKWKSLVKNAVRSVSEKEIKLQFMNYSKLKDEKFQTEDFSLKEYIFKMNLKMARTNFRVRSSMLPFKMNMKSDKKFADEMWRCDSCFSAG